MTADSLAFPAILVLIALVFQALGFLARDELLLRGLILVGTIFYLLFYYFNDGSPASRWSVIFASGMLGVVNLGMIIVLVFERTTFAMSEEMTRIYRNFPTLNPGQFRKLMKRGHIKSAKPGKVLTTDGQSLKRLILMIGGQVKITKGSNEYFADADMFIGEVSFLGGGSASASVEVSESARYVEWRHSDLRRLMRKSDAMNNALIALFGAELAGKVKNAMRVKEPST